LPPDKLDVEDNNSPDYKKKLLIYSEPKKQEQPAKSKIIRIELFFS